MVRGCVSGFTVLLLFAAGVGCGGPKGTSGPSTTGGSSVSCGAIGGRCSPEGTTCSQAPIGNGWSHMLQCSGGVWKELEIAPLPQPPPRP